MPKSLRDRLGLDSHISKPHLTLITHACGHTVSHPSVGHFGAELYKTLEQKRPCQPCIAAHHAEQQALQDLRESAQKILLLTDGVETIPQAAQRLYHQVTANNADPDVHRHAELGLERLSTCVFLSINKLIDSYVLGSAEEDQLDGC